MADKTLSTVSKARIKMTGITPGFIMNSPRGIDPDDELIIAIKAITAKGSRKTPEERVILAALEWRISLYQDNSGCLIFPYQNLIVALAEAGKAKNKGTAIIDRGAILPGGSTMFFGFTGPDGSDMEGKPLDEDMIRTLSADDRYCLTAALNGNPSGGKRKSMVMKTRPMFMPWHMTAELTVFHDDLGWDDFREIVTISGRQGLGNARKIGYGRFDAEIERIS